MKDSARGATDVQSSLSSPAGQGESGEVGLADGLPAGWAGVTLADVAAHSKVCLLYTSPSPRDRG